MPDVPEHHCTPPILNVPLYLPETRICCPHFPPLKYPVSQQPLTWNRTAHCLLTLTEARCTQPADSSPPLALSVRTTILGCQHEVLFCPPNASDWCGCCVSVPNDLSKTPSDRDSVPLSKRSVNFAWGSEKVRGVNLGGWLVLEP